MEHGSIISRQQASLSNEGCLRHHCARCVGYTGPRKRMGQCEINEKHAHAWIRTSDEVM